MSNNDLFEDVELATPSNTDTGVVDVIQEDRPKTTDGVSWKYDRTKPQYKILGQLLVEVT